MPISRHITFEQAVAILAAEETSPTVIAEYAGVSYQTVINYKMLKTEAARNVNTYLANEGFKTITWTKKPPRYTPMSDDVVREIRASKEPSGKIAKRLGVSSSTVRMVRTGQTYKGVV